MQAFLTHATDVLSRVTYKNWTFLVARDMDTSAYLQVRFAAPDSTDPAEPPNAWGGRKWRLTIPSVSPALIRAQAAESYLRNPRFHHSIIAREFGKVGYDHNFTIWVNYFSGNRIFFGYFSSRCFRRHTSVARLYFLTTPEITYSFDGFLGVFSTSVVCAYFLFCFSRMLVAKRTAGTTVGVEQFFCFVNPELFSDKYQVFFLNMFKNYEFKFCFLVFIPCSLQKCAVMFISSQEAEMSIFSLEKINGASNIHATAGCMFDGVDNLSLTFVHTFTRACSSSEYNTVIRLEGNAHRSRAVFGPHLDVEHLVRVFDASALDIRGPRPTQVTGAAVE